jgi:hypothetical protein
MSWGQEIFRAFLLIFGVVEIITNTTYLVKKNGLKLARKQHGELPPAIGDEYLKTKVICMLISGIIVFGVASLSYLLQHYDKNVITGVLVLFSLYGITEALYYRYWKTTGFACVTLLMLTVSLLIH